MRKNEKKNSKKDLKKNPVKKEGRRFILQAHPPLPIMKKMWWWKGKY